jgi:ribonuclease BN (tRNA processing enzyme)
MSKTSVTCLGVGDGWTCADRNHAAFLYRFGRQTLLVDSGEPVDGSLKAAGVAHQSLDAILFSHLHSDHVGGFFMLVQGLWLNRRTRDLPVYLPGGGIRPVRALLNTVLLFPELMQFRLKFNAWKANRSISVGTVRVTPFATTHLAALKERFGKRYAVDYSAFGFLFESGRQRIVHSGDLGRVEDLEPMLAKPVDLLVCELSHLAPETLFDYLRGRKIGNLVCVHLSDEQWRRKARVRRLARRLLPGIAVSIARDGETFHA